ncbi:sulfatase [Salmonella enterica subsp. arizonae]|uniref:Sulfatase n=1 Tax=Salmonella enterica subsp. arizonae TaxID=59203 RepID=A0A3S5DGB3_SALER|nr:sulfatase [Salmonella enterica subsp. arizonae]
MPARRELHTGRYNFLHREWGPLEPFDDSMPELLKKAGIYTHLISDHLHYWEDGGGNYHNRYSSWDVVRGQEGDHWKASVGEPPIPEVLRIPQKQTEAVFPGCGVKTGQIANIFSRKPIFLRQKFLTPGAILSIKIMPKIIGYCRLRRSIRMNRFIPPRNIYRSMTMSGKAHTMTGRVAKSVKVRRRLRIFAVVIGPWFPCATRNLGRILDLMDERNLWRDTMLIVGTDHGFLLGEHGWWAKNQMPYYNEVANSPLFIWDPRSAVCGARRQSLVQMIDWAPTLLDYFQQPIPADVQGQALAKVIASNESVREGALFGVFSGHVNVTDGRYVYMRAAQPGREHDIANYTLMPIKMNARYDVDELGKLSLAPPFNFTKGLQVLRIPPGKNIKV